MRPATRWPRCLPQKPLGKVSGGSRPRARCARAAQALGCGPDGSSNCSPRRAWKSLLPRSPEAGRSPRSPAPDAGRTGPTAWPAAPYPARSAPLACVRSRDVPALHSEHIAHFRVTGTLTAAVSCFSWHGTRTSRTPSLYVACTSFSVVAAGTAISRSNSPYRNSER